MATIDPTKRAAVSWRDHDGPDSSDTKLTVAWLDRYDREMAYDLRGAVAFWLAQVFKARDASIAALRSGIARAEQRELAALAHLDEARALIRKRHGMECATYDQATGTCGGCEVSEFLAATP